MWKRRFKSLVIENMYNFFMILSPNLTQYYGLAELLRNPYFAPNLEHLVINDVLEGDHDDNHQLFFTSHLLSFADLYIQPSTGGNVVKRREVMKDIIVLGDYADFQLEIKLYSPDDNKVS